MSLWRDWIVPRLSHIPRHSSTMMRWGCELLPLLIVTQGYITNEPWCLFLTDGPMYLEMIYMVLWYYMECVQTKIWIVWTYHKNDIQLSFYLKRWTTQLWNRYPSGIKSRPPWPTVSWWCWKYDGFWNRITLVLLYWHVPSTLIILWPNTYIKLNLCVML